MIINIGIVLKKLYLFIKNINFIKMDALNGVYLIAIQLIFIIKLKEL